MKVPRKITFFAFWEILMNPPHPDSEIRDRIKNYLPESFPLNFETFMFPFSSHWPIPKTFDKFNDKYIIYLWLTSKIKSSSIIKIKLSRLGDYESENFFWLLTWSKILFVFELVPKSKPLEGKPLKYLQRLREK